MAPTNDVLVERPANGTAVVVFSGEHDLASTPDVKELLDSLLREEALVVADSPAAKFVDSAILNVVPESHARAVILGKVFRLQIHTQHIVRRAFEMAGVFSVVQHVTTREEALRREKS